MTSHAFRRLTGALFIAGALLVNIPYALLMVNFNYPDVLRQSPGAILRQFQAGGGGLIATWLAFAWLGLPILFALIMLQRILEREQTPYLLAGTVAGVIGGIAQMVGLLRWVFVVPVLAQIYTDPAASEMAKEAAIVAFQAVHQYGGVVVGEHIGQLFTIFWMLATSAAMFRSALFKSWVAWLGLIASAVYVLAQLELLETVRPDTPVLDPAGLVGSLLWLAWMVVIGVTLLRSTGAAGSA